jgi:osmoprotectant transport system ATP-binding protein
VVRAELQDEFLRLQGELGKTIIFVTHDIDEAVKLGDQVAVLKVGGTLGQLAPPSVLLTDPVDDFVAGFVGRDRGYRALGFEPAPSVDVRAEQTVTLGDDGATAGRAATDGWVLAIDETRRPIGWVRAAALGDGQVVAPDLLHRGGTLAPVSGTLRQMLDAALSSPSGRGVLVGDDGALAGTVTATEVVHQIEHRLSERRTEPSEPSSTPSSSSAAPEAVQ